MRKIKYLIVGAGPAGLQLAYYLEKSKSDYLVLEKAEKAGNFFKEFPRHRKLISINKVYTGVEDPEANLRWDWNSLLSDDPEFRLKKYTKEYFPSADTLVDYLEDYAKHFQLNIAYNTEVKEINKEGDTFIVTTANGEKIHAEIVVVGTGLFKPFIPDIPGLDQCDNYTNHSIDTNDYINQKVLVVGKGNSGFETADHLVGVASLIHVVSPNPIKLAWKTHFVGHLRAVNNNLLDTYQLKSQNALLDANIKKIEVKDGKYWVTLLYTHAKEEEEAICYDKVLVATGFKFDDTIFNANLKPALSINDRFPKQTYEFESSNIPNLYFIGVIMQQRDYKKHTSAFIHGFRYNVEFLAKVLAWKHETKPFEKQDIGFSAKAFTDQLIKRINQSSSIWQQFGFIGDLLVVDFDTLKAEYYENLKVAFMHESKIWEDKHLLILTLEYGHIGEEENVFQLERTPSVEHADQSKFLHPIIRHYYKNELISEHHVLEDLHSSWMDPELHITPLFNHLEQKLEEIGAAKVS